MINTKAREISQIDKRHKKVGNFHIKIDKLKNWIFNHPKIVNSYLENENISIKDKQTCEAIKYQKLMTQIPIRYLHNYLKNYHQGEVSVEQGTNQEI